MPKKNQRIILVGVLLFVLVIANAAIVTWSDVSAAQRNGQNKLNLISAAVENNANIVFDVSNMALDDLAAELNQSEESFARLEELQVHYLKSLPFFVGLALINAEGLVITSTSLTDRGTRVDLNRLFPNQAYGGEVLIGPWARGRTLAENSQSTVASPSIGFVPLARRTNLSNSEPAILLAQINLQYLAAYHQQLLKTIPPGSRITLYLDNETELGQWEGQSNNIKTIPQRRPNHQTGAPLVNHGDYDQSKMMWARSADSSKFHENQTLFSFVEMPYPSTWELVLVSAGERAPLTLAALAAILFGSYSVWRNACANKDMAVEKEKIKFELLQKEIQISAIAYNSHESIIWTDTNGVIYKNNNISEAPISNAVDFSVGKSLKEISHEDDIAVIEKLFSTQPPFAKRSVQVRIISCTGDTLAMDISVTPLLGSDGQLAGFIGSALDITEEMSLKRQLKNHLIFSNILLETAPQPIFTTDLDGRYLSVNQAWEILMGFNREEVLGLKGSEFLPSVETFGCVETGENSTKRNIYDKQIKVADGSIRDVRVTEISRVSHDGHPLGSLFFMSTISDRDANQDSLSQRTLASMNGEFSMRVNQELRHPLQSILGYSELGIKQIRADPRNMFAEIHAAGMSIVEFLNESISILNSHFRIDSFSFERSDVRALIQKVAIEIAPRFTSNNISIELRLGDSPLLVKVDSKRLAQVLRHLLYSAARFSPNNQVIQISTETDNCDDVHILVCDKGPGRAVGSTIESSEIQAIFSSLAQPRLEAEDTNADELDLDVCQKIIKANAGRLYTTNIEGGGFVFHIILPKASLPQSTV